MFLSCCSSKTDENYSSKLKFIPFGNVISEKIDLDKKIDRLIIAIKDWEIAKKNKIISQYSRKNDYQIVSELSVSNQDSIFKTPDYEKYALLIDQLLFTGTDIRPYILDYRFEVYNETINSFKMMGENRLNGYTSLSGQAREEKFAESYEIYKNEKHLNGKIKHMEKFIHDYKDDLLAAEKRFEVDKELIVGIIAIESNYGLYTGNKIAFNALVSTYLTGIEKYQNFALRELPELIRISEEKKIPLFEIKSNFAGAIGPMQAIPSSINRTFIGEDLYNMTNNILSIGNYMNIELKRTKHDKTTALLGYNYSNLYANAVLELESHAKTIFSEIEK